MMEHIPGKYMFPESFRASCAPWQCRYRGVICLLHNRLNVINFIRNPDMFCSFVFFSSLFPANGMPLSLCRFPSIDGTFLSSPIALFGCRLFGGLFHSDSPIFPSSFPHSFLAPPKGRIRFFFWHFFHLSPAFFMPTFFPVVFPLSVFSIHVFGHGGRFSSLFVFLCFYGLSVQRFFVVLFQVRDGYRLEKPEHCRRELYNIMYYCWAKDPNERPSFSELVQLLDKLLLTEMDYIELERFPDHNYYNMLSLSGEKL